MSAGNGPPARARAALAPLLCAIALAALLAACGRGDPGPRLTQGVTYGGAAAEALRAAFEAGRGRHRVLALMSPT